MAGKAKKDQAGAAALQAVEDALTIDFNEVDLKEEETDTVADPEFQNLEDKLAQAAHALRDDETGEAQTQTENPGIEQTVEDATVDEGFAVDEITEDFTPDITPLPANDDHDEHLAKLHHLLQQKPSRQVYWFAAVASGLWISLCVFYAYSSSFVDLSSNQSLLARVSDPRVLLTIGAATVPVLLLWAFAVLMRRAQEMRNAASSMSEAALRLLQPDNVANESVTTVGRAIRREVAAIGDGVERAIARAGELEFLVQNEVMNLERSYGDSEIRLRKLVEEITNEREEIIGHAEKLHNSISNTHIGLSSELQSAGSRIEDTARHVADKLNEVLDDRAKVLTATLDQSGENIVSSLVATADAVSSQIAAGKDDLETNLTTKSSEISQMISMTGEAVATLLDTRTVTLREQGEEITRGLEDSIAIRSSEFSSRISEAGDIVQSALDKKLTAIDARLVTQGSNLVSALGSKAEELDKLLQERSNAISDTVTIRSDEFSNRIAEAGDAIQSTLDNKITAIDASLKTGGGNLVSALGSKAQELDKLLQERTNAISDTVTIRSDEFSSRIAEAGEAIQSTLDDKITAIDASLKTGGGNLVSALGTRTAALNKVLQERTDVIGQTIATSLSGFGDSLTGQVDETVGKLQKQTKALEDNTKDVENIITKRTKSVEDALKKGTVDLANTIGENLKTIAGKSEDITNVLAERTKAIHADLGENLAASQRTLEDKTKEFNELLANRMNELSGIIENDALPVVASIEAAGSAVHEKLNASHDKVANEANVLFARIGDSTDLLQSLIEKTSINLGAMQKDISGETERFAAAVFDTKSKVEESAEIAKDTQIKLAETSVNVLTGMSNIAERLENQGGVLHEATRLIDAAQTNFESTLEAKQQSLQDLAVGLVSRSDEINKTMGSFGEMITTMVEDVNVRSKGVGGAVSAEISAAIDDATQRFSEAADAMRVTAEAVRSELEETRTQMRRGVLELPDETHQSATAMRRVVADQVAALRDLSDIVQKSGKMLDATPAATRAGVQQQFPAHGSHALAEPQQPAFPPPLPPRTAQSGPPPLPPRQPPRQAAHAPSLDAHLRGTVDPVAEYAGEPNAHPGHEPQQGKGWVSDLLRRASNEGQTVPPAPPSSARTEQPGDNRSPLHVVESLNSLSMDIARAIDHETSVELWERYQRGERNVFTRRLYTLQGQQTFDEIRDKYLREPEFHAAVDRYVEDFERLLRDVSVNDRDSMMTQTYLTSDTGKVYTMLAHAAGRLGNAA